MATQAQQAEQHRLTQAAVAAAFIQAMRELWPSLDPRAMLDTAPGFQRNLYAAVADYSSAAIAGTAQRFELMRLEAGARDRLRLPVVELPTREEVDETFRILTTDLWQPAATNQAFLDAVTTDAEYNLSESLADKVVDTGRREMDAAIETDPRVTRFAREVTPGCCAWCAMLATRGFVYVSAETAGALKKFHPGDRCTIVPGLGQFEMSETAREAKALYDRVTKNVSGRAKARAFRRAWERGRDGELANDSATSGSDRGTTKRTPSQGFDSMSLEQIELQITVTEPLKDSEWRTKQLERLRKRAAQLAAA